MANHALSATRSLSELYRYFLIILRPERSFYWLAIVYGVGISLLSLATPVSVQMLINTVANTGLTTPLIVLSLTLFGLLVAAGLLQALRIHLMDLFARRFYARMVSEIALRSVYAVNPFFEDTGKGALFNRYFDLVIVQKRLPVLFVGGFAVVLQTVVGFALVSFYHPYLFIFNVFVIILVWLVWAVWGKGAIRTALEVSHSKHATAAWLEGLGASNGFFKTEQHIDQALASTESYTSAYVHAHRQHFRYTFSQTLAFLLIWATASALLLGLGGWLVIQGQLSLGQLVAAELVLSVVFLGISQLGVYLTYFYDLCAAIEEISLFYDVEQDPPREARHFSPADSTLRFADVLGEARGVRMSLDFEIPAGSWVLASSFDHAEHRMMTNFLKGHETPESGYIALGGEDIRGHMLHEVRQHIIVIDRQNVMQTTIRDYLVSSAPDAEQRLLEALEEVGLEPVIRGLREGLDTPIAESGWPLTMTETMQLKLAAALLARPEVLVLSEIYDAVPKRFLEAALGRLRDQKVTIIYFSARGDDLSFDRYLYLGEQHQTLYDSFPAYVAAAGGL